MNFKDIKLKDIQLVIRYKPTSSQWVAKNRNCHILGVHTAGTAIHTFEHKTLTFTKGCIYFLNEYDDYTVNVIEEVEAFSVHFTTYEPINQKSFCIKLSDTSEIESIIEKIQIQKRLTAKSDNLASSYFYKICDIFETICDSRYVKKDSRLIEAKNYIDCNYKEKYCSDKASSLCGISRRRFNELFKEQFKITPNRYIIVKKIDFAKKMLAVNYMSISEIANLCGFSDVYYFSKIFKHETGLTPSAYRHIILCE